MSHPVAGDLCSPVTNARMSSGVTPVDSGEST